MYMYMYMYMHVTGPALKILIGPCVQFDTIVITSRVAIVENCMENGQWPAVIFRLLCRPHQILLRHHYDISCMHVRTLSVLNLPTDGITSSLHHNNSHRSTPGTRWQTPLHYHYIITTHTGALPVLAGRRHYIIITS